MSRVVEASRHLACRASAAMDDVGARLTRRRDAERGQGLVEYGLILILIAIVVIVILGVVGKQVHNAFSNVANGLSA